MGSNLVKRANRNLN